MYSRIRRYKRETLAIEPDAPKTRTEGVRCQIEASYIPSSRYRKCMQEQADMMDNDDTVISRSLSAHSLVQQRGFDVVGFTST